MATVSDIITDALIDLAVLGAGETLSTADADGGLRALNRLVDQWAAERLAIYAITRTPWTIVASDGQYTVGTGGDINVARPVFLDHVHLIDTSTDPDQETELKPFTDDQWAALGLKALTSPYPSRWYYNPTYPLGTLDLWPVPTGTTLQGALYAPAAVSEFAALTTTISLPPGWREMLVTNLAIRLAPSYGAQPSPLLLRQAEKSMATVRGANVRPSELGFEGAPGVAGGSSYDINTDE